VSAPFVVSCLATTMAALLAVGFRAPIRRPAEGSQSA